MVSLLPCAHGLSLPVSGVEGLGGWKYRALLIRTRPQCIPAEAVEALARPATLARSPRQEKRSFYILGAGEKPPVGPFVLEAGEEPDPFLGAGVFFRGG